MKLSRVNNILLGLIILVDGYIILAPCIPVITFWIDNRGGTKRQELTAEIHAKSAKNLPDQPNHVIIPSMLLNTPILEGPVAQQYQILNKGVWRWPAGSTPDKGGNTTLIGHRFTYTNPKGIFYYLNKVKVSDEIGVWWSNKTYTYKVTNIQEVPPTDTAIENPTTDARLTVFTCTPLWLPKDRLVITAELEKN